MKKKLLFALIIGISCQVHPWPSKLQTLISVLTLSTVSGIMYWKTKNEIIVPENEDVSRESITLQRNNLIELTAEQQEEIEAKKLQTLTALMPPIDGEKDVQSHPRDILLHTKMKSIGEKEFRKMLTNQGTPSGIINDCMQLATCHVRYNHNEYIMTFAIDVVSKKENKLQLLIDAFKFSWNIQNQSNITLTGLSAIKINFNI